MGADAVRPHLALDCSTRGGSVAVGFGDEVAAQRVLPAGPGASSLLMPAVDEAVREAGLTAHDLGAVVVGGGPGSFTGLRIAAATAKALVRSLGVPLFAYSGLLATAAAWRDAERPVAALFDARNREVFAGCWRFSAGGVQQLLAPTVLGVAELGARLGGESPLLVGDGATGYAAELLAAFGGESLGEDGATPAEGLLWLAAVAPALGRVADPAAWEPDYLRASGAERIAAARGA